MACRDQRTYLQKTKNVGTPMPPVPAAPANWETMVSFLQGVKDFIEGKVDKTPVPGPVRGFGYDTEEAGYRLSWIGADNAEFYVLYRATSNDFATAEPIYACYAPADQRNFMKFFDVYGQNAIQTTRVYWIQAFNKNGIGGPLSNSYTLEDIGLPTGGGGFHPLDADFTFMNH